MIIGHQSQTALTHVGVFGDFVLASVEVQGQHNWEPGLLTKIKDCRQPLLPTCMESYRVGVLDIYIQKADGCDLPYRYQLKTLDFGTKEKDKKVLV